MVRSFCYSELQLHKGRVKVVADWISSAGTGVDSGLNRYNEQNNTVKS